MRYLTYVLALSVVQLGAQTLPPLLFSNLPNDLRQTVVGQFSQQCENVTPPVGGSCSTVAGNELFTRGASGSNKYDAWGALYLLSGNAILRMSPEGVFTKIVDAPASLTCSQPTPTSVKITSKGFGEFSFNPAIDALYIVTLYSEAVFSLVTGGCNSDGTFTGTVSTGTTKATDALVRVDGFKRFSSHAQD